MNSLFNSTDKIIYKLLKTNSNTNNTSGSESEIDMKKNIIPNMIEDNDNLALEISNKCVTSATVSCDDSDESPINMGKRLAPATKVFFEYLTNVTHIVIVLFVVFILYLSFSHEIELFTWHPILLSISWMFLMIEAILALSSDNSLIRWIPPRNRVSFHWIVQTTATICTTSGFLVVYINKNIKNKLHFQTWHGIFGLVSFICLIPTCVFGFFTLYKIDLRKHIKPIYIKVFHVSCGVLTFIIGTVTVLLGLYSNWFMKRANMTAHIICFIAVFVSTVWILFRPFKSVYHKINTFIL